MVRFVFKEEKSGSNVEGVLQRLRSLEVGETWRRLSKVSELLSSRAWI